MDVDKPENLGWNSEGDILSTLVGPQGAELVLWHPSQNLGSVLAL